MRRSFFPQGKLARMAVVALIGMILLFILFMIFGGDLEKYSGPSGSSTGAKWRRVFLTKVDLVPIKNDLGVRPTEAWIERIYENYESVPIRIRSAGVRMCVRFEKWAGDPVTRPSNRLTGKIAINGSPLQGLGGLGDRRGLTVDFYPNPTGTIPSFRADPLEVFPPEGEIIFSGETFYSKFRYTIQNLAVQ